MRLSLLRALVPLTLATGVAFASGCSSSAQEEDSSEGALGGNIKSMWKDVRKLDSRGWMQLAGGVASDQSKDAISGSLVNFDWDVRVTSNDQNLKDSRLSDDLKVFSLNTITTGLLQRFGDQDLPTRVNRLRLDRVQDGSFYLDAMAKVGSNVSHGWSITGPDVAGAGDASLSFGFNAGASIESRAVVHAAKNTFNNEFKTWMRTIVNGADYLFSKDPEKVDKMKPGESWGMRGQGKVGAYAGIGVPIYVGDPALNVVVSAAMSGSLGGNVDVQVVKLENNQVIVDLGIEDVASQSWSLGVNASYGVPDVCKNSETGKNGDCLPGILKDRVPRLISKQLNKYLSASVTTGSNKGSSRVSVLRLRFDFDAATGEEKNEVRAAYARAIRFDARHAQTLYYQKIDSPRRAVTVETDLFRSMSTSSRFTSWNMFGIPLYDKRDNKIQGIIGVKTPSDTKLVSYDVRNARKGWGETRHGFERVGVASLSHSGGSEANFVLNLATSDGHFSTGNSRMLIVNNADATIVASAGLQAANGLDAFGNVLQSKAERCTTEACLDGVLGGKEGFALAKDAQVRGIEAGEHTAVAQEAARLRLTAQGLYSTEDVLDAPSVDFTFGLRLDDQGIGEMLDPGKVQAFKDRAYDYLVATTSLSSRSGIAPAGSVTKEQIRTRLLGEEPRGGPLGAAWPVAKNVVDKLAEVYAQSAREYADLKGLEDNIAGTLSEYKGAYSPVFIGLSMKDLDDVLEGQRDNQKNAQSLAISSIAHKRAMVPVRLIDNLHAEGESQLAEWRKLFAAQRNMPLWAEHLAGYTLAQLVSPAHKELTIDVRVGKSDLQGRYVAAGLDRWATTRPITTGKVTRISLGALDLEATMRN